MLGHKERSRHAVKLTRGLTRQDRRRVWLLAYTIFLAIVVFFGFPATAFAYIDPATTSYIIQIVSGLIISLSVAFGVFFRRIQMAFVTTKARLGALWVRLTSKRHRQLWRLERRQAKRQRKAAQAAAAREPLVSFLFKDDRSLKQRLIIAVLLAGAFSFSFVLFSCIDLFVNNTDGMPFPLTMILGPTVLLFLAVFVVLALMLAVLRGRVFDCATCLVFGATLALYIQGNFLNSGLGQLTGDTPDWESMLPDMIGNAIICALIVLLPLVIWLFAKKAYQGLVRFVPALLIAMQLVALVVGLSTSGVLGDRLDDETFLSDAGLYEVSPGHNTVVLLLDRLDQRYIEELLAREPDFFAGRLDGFTRYTNNLATAGRTYPSVINMLTGANYQFEVPADDFMRSSWQGGSFLPTLRQSGSICNIYTEYNYAYLDGNDLKGSADNVDSGPATIDAINSLGTIMTVSAYRYLPLAFKPAFWLSTEDIATHVSYRGKKGTRYESDDHGFFARLRTQGLDVSTTSADRFTFIHCKGTHPPFDVDYDFNKVPRDQSSLYYQARFAFSLVFEYLDNLRQLGLYDDATIIITGDHGYTVNLDWHGDYYPLQEPELTGLFVKLSGETGTPLRFSSAPVNSDQLRATVLEQAGLDYADFGPTYAQVPPDSSRLRQFTYRIGSTGSSAERYLQLFIVKPDAADFANWEEVGRVPILYWHG
ncbi:MAG: LTA synthase family protein [Coriobacteriales bacterium]|jgi:hypothetical protein|nr:LTA synthase family protein [Coriobacteriales bacterium]